MILMEKAFFAGGGSIPQTRFGRCKNAAPKIDSIRFPLKMVEFLIRELLAKFVYRIKFHVPILRKPSSSRNRFVPVRVQRLTMLDFASPSRMNLIGIV